MSYSVMVRATELLFGGFYREIAGGESVGVALDKARLALLQERKRRDLQRGQERVVIEVSDWFLPTLYQAGEDTPLVSEMTAESPQPHPHNLSALPDAGFWGRRKELWQIENWFGDGVRRVVVSGFSGQGKTFLAQELGRWLLQKSKFDAVVLVDYSGYQGLDAVQWAVTTLGSVVGQSLVDVAAANVVLQNQRILLILDNLEVYVAEKNDILQELLTVAQRWSLLGGTKVLVTTRPVDLGHEAYQVGGEDFRSVLLEGLGTEDALHYFERLLVLVDNPVRLQTDELLRWFAKVQFQPLSIGLLARSLETEDLENLEGRLNQLMLELPDNPVAVTLQLVIEQLDEESRRLLPRLGVFQGGALESFLRIITRLSEEQWQTLRAALETTGLIQAELMEGVTVPYIHFHPILTPALKTLLATEKLAKLHQESYYQLSGYLYNEDNKNPLQARAIVLRELPNLLYAVKGALATKTDNAVSFVNYINKFLGNFGFSRDRADLTQQAEQIGGYLALGNKGQHLFSQGQYQAAEQVFNEALTSLGEQPSFEHCATLIYLGRCFEKQGQAEQAIAHYRQGLAVAEQLEQSKNVKRHQGALHTGLADVLTVKRDFEKARKAFEAALSILKEIDDQRSVAIINGQLGTLALLQNNFQEAAERYRKALAIFQRLNELESEAALHHQLGMVYEEEQQWNAAEQAYRESARIKESQGNLAGAANTWNGLAVVSEKLGNFEAAEAWFRRVIEVAKSVGDLVQVASSLNNLADLLQTNYPDRLPEARQLAEEALAIRKTQDPAVSDIWQTYSVLAEIAEQEGDGGKAEEYRGLSELNKPV